MGRFLPFEYYNPYFKTGLNKALIESVSESGDTVIFIAGWEKKCVNLGYSQKFEDEVDIAEFEKREEVVLVRRQGGGGTTYLTPEGEITWGIVAPEKEFPKDVNKIYEQVCGKIAKGLNELGIEAEHEPINDIVTDQGKISGATLKQEKGVIYIGGTLLYENNPEEMFKILTPDEDKIRDKNIEKFEERVSCVKNESEASFDEAVKALRNSLLDGKNFQEDELKDSEVKRAEKLADKYSSDEWLYRK